MICITGAHRSGTSMVARLLQECGLYLGPAAEFLNPAPDNPEGFWENIVFVNFNDRLLSRQGGSWHQPPADNPGWHLTPPFLSFQEEARELLARFQPREPWGWKDPRNALTLPFWKHLLPGLKTVICVRHPFAVARSLEARGDRVPALPIWQEYNCRLLRQTAPEDRVITHYDSYFYDPRAELERVLAALGLPADPARIDAAVAGTKQPLRHHADTIESILKCGDDLLACYMALCAEAGPVLESAWRLQPVRIGSWCRPVRPASDQAIDYHDAVQMLRLEEERRGLESRCLAAEGSLAGLTQELEIARQELESATRSRAWRLAHRLQLWWRALTHGFGATG